MAEYRQDLYQNYAKDKKNPYGESRLSLNGSDFYVARSKPEVNSLSNLTYRPAQQATQSATLSEPVKPIPVTSSGGTQGLISGIFGQDRTITQPYGKYNPVEPTRGHINTGTDIRTGDLSGEQRQLSIPVEAEIVEVKRDDGTRFGKYTGHQGYGNSVLVRLPSGEMLRFSHLSSLTGVEPGKRLPAGTVFGTPGQTGNTYGEHLDLEYYNKSGKIDNPDNFTGFNSQGNFQPQQQPQQPETMALQMPQGQMPTMINQPSSTPLQNFQKVPSPSMYSVKQGDTLWGIAQQKLGNGARWQELGYKGDPRKLQVGTQLRVG